MKTAELKKADNFTIKHEFSAEWARFTGDAEALHRSDRALTSRLQRNTRPVEDEMVA